MTATAALPALPEPPREQITAWASELEGATPDAIIRFAVEQFGPAQIAVATQFGAEGCTLLHRVAQIAPAVRFFTIDTGLLFHETYALADRLEARLGIHIERVAPRQSVAEQAVTHGPNLWERDPDLCCTLRKVQPMLEALHGMGAWMTGLRREQSPSRAHTPVVQWDERFGLVKFAPLATQRSAEVEAYIRRHHVPTNPLRQLGYPSLGCFTCTRPVKPGEDPRAGRWWRSAKTECGLHQG